MIQRIQSVYLLLATVAYSLLFVFPISELIANPYILEFNIFGLYEQKPKGLELIAEILPTLALAITAWLFSFVALFLFKNRKIQMRLTAYSAVVSLGFIGISIYYLYQIFQTHTTELGFPIGLILSASAFILQVLAYRAILKDDLLIKSIDRIR